MNASDRLALEPVRHFSQLEESIFLEFYGVRLIKRENDGARHRDRSRKEIVSMLDTRTFITLHFRLSLSISFLIIALDELKFLSACLSLNNHRCCTIEIDVSNDFTSRLYVLHRSCKARSVLDAFSLRLLTRLCAPLLFHRVLNFQDSRAKHKRGIYCEITQD